MGYAFRQLINAIRGVLNDIAGIREAMSTIASQDERQDQEQHVTVDVPGTINVKAEISEPEPIRKTKNTTETRRFRLNFGIQAILALGTIGAFAAASYYAYWAKATYMEIAKQTPKITESADVARESLESVQRAFIVFDSIQTTSLERDMIAATKGETEYTSTFSARCENAGDTPAKGITQSLDGRILPNEPTEAQFSNSGRTHRAYVVGPKAPYVFGNTFEHMAFFQSVIEQIRKQPNNKRGAFFWGWVTYRDIFPKTKIHLTEFCERIGSIATPTDKDGEAHPERGFMLMFETCDHHNCTDEDCDDYASIVAISPPSSQIQPLQ